jgi:hypothetical protein
MLVKESWASGGQPPFSQTPFDPMLPPETRMKEPTRSVASILGYAPAGLLVLYALIRLLF